MISSENFILKRINRIKTKQISAIYTGQLNTMKSTVVIIMSLDVFKISADHFTHSKHPTEQKRIETIKRRQ